MDKHLRHHSVVGVTLLDGFNLQRPAFHQTPQGFGGSGAQGLVTLRRVDAVQADRERPAGEIHLDGVAVDNPDESRGEDPFRLRAFPGTPARRAEDANGCGDQAGQEGPVSQDGVARSCDSL